MIAALLAALLSRTQAARIDSVVATVMHERHIAALTLGIARPSAAPYLRGYGYASGNRRADGFTIYGVGSIAKQFTAALVLQQVADGRLALESGSPPIARLLDQTVTGAFVYDNANYAALGAVLEKLSAMPYCSLLERDIAAPLQLHSTGCGVSPYAWNVAAAGAGQSQSLAPAAGGGVFSNVPDLLTWLERLRSGAVIPPPLFAQMATSAAIDGVPTGYGFGFFTRDWYGYRVLEHSGYVGGYSADDALVLDDGLAVAVLSNGDRSDLTALSKSIVAILEPQRDANRYAQVGAPAQNENGAVTRALQALLATPGFARLGTLESLEFIERSVKDGLTLDRYRATFSAGRRRVTVGYRDGSAIESLLVEPEPR